MIAGSDDHTQERANRQALRAHVNDTSDGAIIILNSLIEQRARRGWPVEESWMRMRDLDTREPMPIARQRELLARQRVVYRRAIDEHRLTEPDCAICRVERQETMN